MKNIIIIFGIVLISTLHTSCLKKDNNNPIPNQSTTTCTITSQIVDTDSTVFNYSGGKLTYAVTYDTTSNNAVTDSLVYSYSSSLVTVDNYQSGSLVQIQKYFLGSNGYASKEVDIYNGSNSITYDTTFYEYNAEGYVIKDSNITTIVYTNPSTPQSITITVDTFDISNGNISTVKSKSNGTTIVLTYQYYSDKENKSNLDLDSSPGILYAQFLGKGNKNLMKGFSNDSGDNVSYSYEIDSNGNVTKTTITDMSGGSSNIGIKRYYYKCQ